MTLGELHLWALVRHWGEERRERLAQHVRKFAVHPYDPALCAVWAKVSHSARINGRPIETADAWRPRDYYLDAHQHCLQLEEKGGKSREIPVRHDLEGFIEADLAAVGTGGS